MRALPPDIELQNDVSPADWITPRLRSGLRTVDSVVPSGYEAYARITHDGEPSQVEGVLPRHQLIGLMPILEEFTSTPERCWFAIWSGYGHWYRESQSLRRLHDGRPDLALEEVATERDRIMRSAPVFKTQCREYWREYFLFRGALYAAGSFEFDPWSHTPNLWWPDDRAWCVGTEIDLAYTLVAASPACIDRILSKKELNVSEARPDLDIGDWFV